MLHSPPDTQDYHLHFEQKIARSRRVPESQHSLYQHPLRMKDTIEIYTCSRQVGLA